MIELNSELIKLQDELSKLESAVTHITKAEKLSTNVIDSAKKIQLDFADKLGEVISYYNDYMSRTSSTTEDNIAEVSSTLLKLADEVNKITADYTKLSESTLVLSEKIESINFPLHLNHIEIKTEEIKSLLADTILTQEAANSDLKSSMNKELDNFLAKQYELNDEVKKLNSSFSKNATKEMKEFEEIKSIIASKDIRFEEINKVIEKQNNQINTLKIYTITTFIVLVIFFVLLMIK
jgi:chromosome segregation ATPase